MFSDREKRGMTLLEQGKKEEEKIGTWTWSGGGHKCSGQRNKCGWQGVDGTP
jgi:hypothetical protein